VKIAVLMTCYNRVGTTLRCLRSLLTQPCPAGCEMDVWLVDDASPDATGERVKAEFPQVHVIQGTGKLFWCRGMCLAWETASQAADYDAYLWLNDDVTLYPNALAVAVADAAQHPDSVLVGAFVDPDNEKSITYGCGDERGCMLKPDGVAPHRGYGCFSGNFVLVPRSVEKKIGRLYGGFTHAYGDYDYAKRLTRERLSFYLASRPMGTCEENHRPERQLKGKGLRERLCLLFKPNGYPLKDTFFYRFRHEGLFRALISVAHVTFMVLRK